MYHHLLNRTPHLYSCTPLHIHRRLQGQLEKLVAKNYYLNHSARDAYRSYVLAYASHSLKVRRETSLVGPAALWTCTTYE